MIETYAFKLMKPVRGIETKLSCKNRDLTLAFQINETRSRD